MYSIEWLKNKFIPKYVPNKREQLVLNIIKGLLEHEDTDIKMAPLTGRYYVVNKRLQYWVKVSEDGVSITNHKFTFSSATSITFYDMIIDIVKEVIEKHRNEFEATVFQNEIELLDSILNNINEKTYE